MDLLTQILISCSPICQGYKMDDLLTSYISQMLTSMSKQRGAKGSKWTEERWHLAVDLIRCLKSVGYPCSWGKTFSPEVWNMRRAESQISSDSENEGSTPPSSEDDYLWGWSCLQHWVTIGGAVFGWVLSDRAGDGFPWWQRPCRVSDVNFPYLESGWSRWTRTIKNIMRWGQK